MIHRLAHWFGWNGCIIVNRDDGMYLRCVTCGLETFYVPYNAQRHVSPVPWLKELLKRRIGSVAISWFWLRLRGLPVTFHVREGYGYQALWTGIYGVRAGQWFFGVVSSCDSAHGGRMSETEYSLAVRLERAAGDYRLRMKPSALMLEAASELRKTSTTLELLQEELRLIRGK